MTDNLITCPVCNGKGAVPYVGTNPGTGNTFRATKKCDTCHGERRIQPDQYPEWLKTPPRQPASQDRNNPWG